MDPSGSEYHIKQKVYKEPTCDMVAGGREETQTIVPNI